MVCCNRRYAFESCLFFPYTCIDADFNHWTIIWIHDGSGACTDFTDLVVDDDIALEGDQNFTILVDGSMAMVTIIDDDCESQL